GWAVFVPVGTLDPAGPQASPTSRRSAPVAPTQPLVRVIWRDAVFDLAQKSSDDFRSEYLVHTVGFLGAAGHTFSSLAQEVLPDDEGFRAVTHIPTSVVERVVVLHPPPEETPAPAE